MLGLWKFYFVDLHQKSISLILELLLFLGMVYLLITIYFAQSKKQYTRISLSTKMLMFTGIFYLISLA